MGKPVALSSKLSYVVFPREEARQRVAALNAAPPPPASPPEPDLPAENAALVNWLFARAGLDARCYRPETLQRRLPACLRVLRAPGAGQARRFLEERPHLVGTALDAMLVGVTGFFRDPPVFDLLLRHLCWHAPPARRGVQAWCAGCSDGCELVSLAILLAEEGRLAGSYLLGTDCRPGAVRRARAGWYGQDALRGLPTGFRERYFLPQDGGGSVRPDLRAALRWRTADVLAGPEPGVWDVILFRNTAMYLRPEVSKRLWARFETHLRPGGLLVLGKAERPAGAHRLAALGPCVYRRTPA
jgi:chemotaxis methyl-accepting protein methylase